MEYNHLKYVEKYVNLNYATYCNIFSNKEINTLFMEISNNIRNKYNDLKLVLNGEADELISSVIEQYMDDKHQEVVTDYVNLKNYVNKYIQTNYNINCGNKTLDVLVEQVCSMLMATYNYDKMMNGNKDEEIKTCYKMVYNDLRDEIRRYAINYISDNVIPLTDVDNVKVSEDVVKLIMTKNNLNVVDLLFGKYDKIINEMACVNRKKNAEKRLADMPDTIEYISSRIIYKTQNLELLEEIVKKIDINLRDKGVLPSEIVSGEYDSEIRLLYNEYYMDSLSFSLKDNSVQREDVPKKIKKNSRKVTMSQAISSVLIAGVLASILATGGYAIGKDIRATQAKKNLSTVDSYDYFQVVGIYSDNFKPTVDNIVKTYDEYSKFGNIKFNYLAFYRAYMSVIKNEMYVMDNMIDQIENKIRNNSKYSELEKTLRTSSCYLDFMYDRLVEMGYTEVRQEKYFDLLSAYVNAKNKHPYDDPVEFLTDSQVRLLNKVKDKYEELSEQYLVELGLYLGSQEDIEQLSDSGRRHQI